MTIYTDALALPLSPETLHVTAAIYLPPPPNEQVVHLLADAPGAIVVGGADVTPANGFPLSDTVPFALDLATSDDLYAVGAGNIYVMAAGQPQP